MSKFIILLAAACLALPAAEGGQSGKCHGDKLRQHVLERFDTDKDGKLSDAEKAAAKAARKEHREERKDKIDR